MSFIAIDPTTGETLSEWPSLSLDAAHTRLDCAHQAFGSWKALSFAARAIYFERAAAILESRSDEFSILMTTEMGKPISQSRAEVKKCAWVCRYFAEHAEVFLQKNDIDSDASVSGVRYDPLGPVLAIMPWNFPFWQVFRFAAPTLMAGNVGLLKHAPNVPGCANAIQSVFDEAGFPSGVFQNLFLNVEHVEPVIANRRLAAVTLTGSVKAGRAVASRAGQYLKPVVLELGGSDPFIVLEDADIESAVEAGLKSRTLNNGQSCIAAKRFIVVDAIYEAFQSRFVEAFAALRVGHPADESTDIGPLARPDLADTLRDQIARSLDAGAVALLGGSDTDAAGETYVQPTVLTNVGPGVPAFDEETFGPCAALIRAADTDDAIRLANLSEFGLGASLWTERADVEGLIAAINAGSVFVNGMVKSDPRLPFGGIKDSGYGRELSVMGIREFVNAKTYWIR